MSKTNVVKKSIFERLEDPEKKARKAEARKTRRENKRPAAESPATGDGDDEDDALDESTGSVDITMDETKRILHDYVILSMKNRSLAGPINSSKVETR
jgi:hypothetical protein